MLLQKVALELCPSLVYLRLMVPLAAGVSETAHEEDEVLGCGYDLFWFVWDLPDVGEVNGRLDLIDDIFKRLIDIVWRVNTCHVELEVRRGNLVLVCL